MWGRRVVASSFGLGALAVAAFFGFAASFRDDTARPASGAADAFICAAARAWRAQHAPSDDLRVVGVEVVFRSDSDGFQVGSGEVLAPVASELFGAQDVLDVRSDPPSTRTLHVDGTAVVAWDYAGSVHRTMHYVAAALVRRPPRAHVMLPAEPTFDTLPDAVRLDARLTARSLEEHRLNRCKAFAAWAKEAGGEPPYTAQLLRIAERVHAGLVKPSEKARKDDVCEALRTGKFTEHYAQVVTVMAARELGAPAYGLESAGAPHSLVATYVDGLGWVTLDLEAPDSGFFTGGSAFIAKVPVASHFDGARDGFWYPTGTAFRSRQNEAQGFSWTVWSELDKARDADSTVTFDRPLEELCP